MFDQFTPQLADGDADEQLFQLPFTVLQVLTNVAVTIFLSAVFILERDAIRRWAGRASWWRATAVRPSTWRTRR
jgi:hypothetical protein